MANEQPSWKRINMGEILPCQSFLRKKDGEILKLSTIGGVEVGQDCYYLPIDDVINVIKDYPVEKSEDERIINNIRKVIGWYRDIFTEESLTPEEYQEIDAWLEKQSEHKPTAEEVLIKAGLKPYKDGNQWCVLLGDNIQEGVCGFGNTIEDALYAFLKDLIASQGEQKLNGTFVNVDDVREDFVQEVYRVLDADSTNDRANQIIDAFDNLPTVAIEKKGEQKRQMPLVKSVSTDFKNRLGTLMHYTSVDLEKEENQQLLNEAAEELLQLAYSDKANEIALASAKTWEESMAILMAANNAYRRGQKDINNQKQWMPSEEQMVALDGICSYIRNKADWEISQDMVSDLYKLSEQLKKLREE